jgi:hypothetical protein
MGKILMTKMSIDYWEDYYAKPENFARCFQDYSDLKNTKRSPEQNVQFKALTEVIDGKFTL